MKFCFKQFSPGKRAANGAFVQLASCVGSLRLTAWSRLVWCHSQTAHTIILTQTSSSEATRTFTDHQTVTDAIESAPVPLFRTFCALMNVAVIWTARKRLMFQTLQLAINVSYSFIVMHGGCTGVCCMFERELKERNSEKRELSYDIKELHTFIDRLVRR